MKHKGRILFFLISAAGFSALYLWGLKGLPAVGHYRGPYGDVLNRVGTYERHVTDIVTAVNFDYRGFDTLGEEFILFMSVVGGMVLLRRQREEQEQESGEQQHHDELGYAVACRPYDRARCRPAARATRTAASRP